VGVLWFDALAWHNRVIDQREKEKRTPCPDKRPDLSDRNSDTIELATYGGTAALTREETEVVPWPDFAETEEDSRIRPGCVSLCENTRRGNAPRMQRYVSSICHRKDMERGDGKRRTGRDVCPAHEPDPEARLPVKFQDPIIIS
jgi:hypothetical protein